MTRTGIPLVFLYLTNIGDYLASLFRILYAKICRRCCEGGCLNNMDSRRRRSILNALKARTSDIDLTLRRDYLLDESLHRNNINIIRRIGTFAVGRDKPKTSKKEDLLMDCVGVNVICNEYVIEMDRLELQKQKNENEVKDTPTAENHRMRFKVSTNSSRSFWLNNNSDVKEESAKENSNLKRTVSLSSPKSPRVVPSPQFTIKPDLFTLPSNTPSAIVIANESADTPKSFHFPQLDNNSKVFNFCVCDIRNAPTHNTGTQTILQAGPNEFLNYRSLCKSFITGHYLRSYRREMQHQRKQMRKRLRTLSQVSTCEPKIGSEPQESAENRKILEINRKKTPDSNLADNVITCFSLQDLKSKIVPNNSLTAAKSTSPILDPKLEHNQMNSGPELKTKSTVSPTVRVVQRKSKASLAQNGKRRDIPVPLYQKSRLSMLSSLADSSNDLAVRLSYYSDDTVNEANNELNQDHREDNFDGEDISKVTVPISLSIMIVTTYILIGACVFCIWEDNNYLKWSYFCFVTLSTIGFGDIVPGTKVDSTNPKEKLIIITIYVAVGLSVFAMCIKLMQEEVVSKFKWLARYIRELKKKVRKHRVEQPPRLESTSVHEEERDIDEKEHYVEEMMKEEHLDSNVEQSPS
ncbi:unnamed protein product [Hymenolepis diminuta]|uniref:Ion_trans_2 domain-containing protein n=1 Tax=Hymenolepis diminuta TaxID=6216 RepID=A0A0R3SSG0_HYMDI|nr:unnamed protein product [Hymenolepis diminuta]